MPAGYPPGYQPPTGGGPVAWENKSISFFARWWATAKAVCFDPRVAMEGIATNDDVGSGVGFAVTSSAIGGVFYGLYSALISFLFAGMIGTFMKGAGPSMKPLAAIYTGMGFVQIIATPIQMAIAAAILPFISAAIFHGILSLFGGTTKTFNYTYRVAAFADASAIFLAVPGFGLFIYIVWRAIIHIIGLDVTHRCGMGKAAAAVLLPPLLLCVCCCGGSFAMGMLGSAANHR
jgi:hypothetical protein